MFAIDLVHSVATGHRIPNHEGGNGKCARLHGHTYTYTVTCGASILVGGFVVDFGRLKKMLDEWDHRLILWADDPITIDNHAESPVAMTVQRKEQLGLLRVPFIPTAENIAKHWAERLLKEVDNLVFVTIVVNESPLSSATYTARRSG